MLSSAKKNQNQATDDEIFSSVQDELDAAVAGEATELGWNPSSHNHGSAENGSSFQ